jgi:5-methylcytosine-specific restriction endonuclease McrA
MSELTYDHVVPRSQGGLSEWTNIVSACGICNTKKGNRTPREAGMKLLSKPIKPTYLSAITLRISSTSAPDAWRDFCYWTDPLEK